MRAAPAVQAALDAGGRERMLIIALHALAGGNLAAWALAHGGRGLSLISVVWVLLAALLLAAVGGWLGRRVLPPQAGQLRWDGQVWQCDGSSPLPLARVVVAIDAGVWVLLRLFPADGGVAVWRVASARGAGNAWHGLRVALASHAGAAQDGAAGPLS